MVKRINPEEMYLIPRKRVNDPRKRDPIFDPIDERERRIREIIATLAIVGSLIAILIIVFWYTGSGTPSENFENLLRG